MNPFTIHQGNNLDVLPTIADESVDLIIADPGYGLNKFGKWDSFMVDYHVQWLEHANRILKPTGQMYVFWGHKHLKQFLEICPNDAIIHWCKPKPIINPQSQRWVASVEYILWSHKSDDFTWNPPVHPTELCNIFTDSLCIQQGEKCVHRCQKPVSIITKLITRSSNEGDTVLDPFMGSGTTLVAAIQTNRIPTGIELDCSYVEIARARATHAATLTKQPAQQTLL